MSLNFSSFKNKKAMEMSMNTVIIAIIALLILGLMIFVLARNTTIFNEGTKCNTYGGRCMTGTNSCGEGNECSIIKYTSGTEKLCNQGETCCSIIPDQGKTIDPNTKDVSPLGGTCNN